MTKLLFEIVYVLADELPISGFRDESRAETPDTRMTRERALPPIAGRLGIRWSDREPDGTGLPLTNVTAGGPAAKAGLRVGDRLMALGGKPIPSNETFRRWILAAPSDTSFTVERPGVAEPLELPITLAGEPLRWGITWREDAAEPGTLFLNRIVVGTSADAAGVRSGDRIDAVDDRRFADQDEFETYLKADKIRLRLERDGKYRTVEFDALTFPKPDATLNN
ncbi:MAG: PDZ domain-containing protein [Pirellulales bacterium]